MRKWAQELPCFYCGGKSEGRDHLIPKSRGGGIHGKANLIPACTRCNGFKRDMEFEEFRVYIRVFATAHPLRIRPVITVCQPLGWRFWGEVHPEVYEQRGVRIPSAYNAPLRGEAHEEHERVTLHLFTSGAGQPAREGHASP